MILGKYISLTFKKIEHKRHPLKAYQLMRCYLTVMELRCRSRAHTSPPTPPTRNQNHCSGYQGYAINPPPPLRKISAESWRGVLNIFQISTNLDRGFLIFSKSLGPIWTGFFNNTRFKSADLGKIAVFRRKKVPKFSPRFARDQISLNSDGGF
mgnify:CR=1 FL=1